MCNDFFFIAAKVNSISCFDSNIKSLVSFTKVIRHFIGVI